MAQATPAAVLTPAQWEKQKGVLAKPTGIPDALKALQRASAAVDRTLLEPDKADAAAAIEKRLAQLDAELAGRVKTACTEARNVATLGKKWEAEFRKAATNPKEASAAAGAVAKAAAAFADELPDAFVAARKLLAARLVKAAADADDGGDDLGAKDIKFLKDKVMAAMRSIKAAKPDAKPIQFVVAAGPKQCLAFLALSVGASHKTLLAKLMPGESGIKYYRGECLFEDKAYTFVGEDIPTGGFSKRLQKGLFELTQLRYPIRVRKTSGETDEAEGEEAADGGASGGSGATGSADPAAAFQARFAVLVGRVKEAMAAGHPAAAELKLKASQAAATANSKDFAKAGTLLAEIEALLSSTKGGAAAEAAQRSWQAAVAAYREASDTVDAQISQLQVKLRGSGDRELEQIADKGLNGVTGNFKVPLLAVLRDIESASAEARPAHSRRAAEIAAGFLKHIESEATVAVCDTNPLAPVSIRATLGPALRGLARAAAAAA
jgi:hypothetical protein